MEGERTFMKNKKLLAKLIFVAILLLIIWYTFKDSAEDIVEQLADIIRNSNTGKQFTVLSTALFTVCLHWEAVPAWQQLCIWAKRAWDIRKQPDFT